MSDTSKHLPHRKPAYKFVAPDRLRFDISNPRLGGTKKGCTQESIQALLESAPHLALELVPSLVENHFIPYEPLIVRSKAKEFVVIEGNRRLAAVKHMLANADKYPELVRKALRKIPVLVFPEDTPDARVRTYLAVHHLFGFRQWPPLSKARFLDSEIKGKGDVARLVHEYGIDKQEILRYLLPHRVVRVADLDDADFQDRDFWILGEALSRSGVKEYIRLVVDSGTLKVQDLDKKKLTYLLEFLYGDGTKEKAGTPEAKGAARITDTRQLTLLGKVLASKVASAVLERGATLEEASLYVETRTDAIAKLLSQISALLSRFSRLKPTNQQRRELRRVLNRFNGTSR